MAGSLWRRLTTLFRRDRLARELDEELHGHYEDLRAALEDEGHAPDEAARLARVKLGGRLQIRESSHDQWRLGWFEGAGQDLRLAVRSLWRRPGFAAAAIATLALGIGASTAIFSVAYGVSLRPLAYPDPDRLVRIYESSPAHGQLKEDVSNGAFQAWREGAASLESIALHNKGGTRTFGIGAERVRVATMSVTPSFFDVLAARPMLGPGFKPEREYTRFTTREIILSFPAWQRWFGGRPDVIGRTVTEITSNNDHEFRVVGVMPESFAYTQAVDVWVPMIVEVPVARILHNWRYDRVVARLKPGATIEQARAELEAAAARLAAAMPASNAGWTVQIESLRASVIGRFGQATWMLLAAVGVVLLVACLNVGGLLVARAVARERETAVRAALGAGSWRLLRLWLAEAAVLGTAGAAIGLVLARLGVSALKAAGPPGIPRLDAVTLDWPTLAVAVLSTLLAIVVFTLAPFGSLVSRRVRHSAGASSSGLVDRLRAGSTGAGDSRRRHATRTALTIAQCAGAAMLVVLAMLLTRSFMKLTAFDLGWRPNGVVSATVQPTMPRELRRPWYRYVEWSDRLIARLEASPGIERAAITTQVPLSLRSFPSVLATGRDTAPDQRQWPGVRHNVTDGYFDLMGIRLTAGRLFAAADRFSEEQLTSPTRPERGVAIISQTTARTLWPGGDPLGQAIRLPDIDNVTWREVIGVVEDIQFYEVAEAPAMHVFIPWTQASTGAPRLLVRGAAGAAIVPIVRQVVEAVEPGTQLDDIAPLEALVARATAQPRFTSRLVGSFGALALTLAAVGIYGTLSYLVGRRMREFGIRLALGAPPRGIVTQVLRRGLVPALAGGAIGLALAVALARAFRALLFGIEPLDAASCVAGALLIGAAALAAALGPARRASRIDPVRALRIE